MTSSNRQDCDLRREDLHKGFDKEPNAPDVAGHVARCAPCSDALSALQGQRDALQFLAGTEHAAEGKDATAIEQILSVTARTGRDKLADLLYELAKACLIVLPNLSRRVDRRIEPREVPVVSGELNRLVNRLGESELGESLLHLPTSEPPEPRALDVARSCLGVLKNVEGESERQQLAMSMLLIFEGTPGGAENRLRGLLSSDRWLTHRDLAQSNMVLALMRQKKYSEAVEIGDAVLRERPDDPIMLYNVTVSLACLRRRTDFEKMADRLARRISTGDPPWLVRLVRYESENFAFVLGCSIGEVEELLGISSISREDGP